MTLHDLAMRFADQDAQLSGHGPLLYFGQLTQQGVIVDRNGDVLEARLGLLDL